jgi:hypothetical protein
MMASHNVRGDCRPLEHERITARQLTYENEKVRENDAGRNDGKMRRPSRRIG